MYYCVSLFILTNDFISKASSLIEKSPLAPLSQRVPNLSGFDKGRYDLQPSWLGREDSNLQMGDPKSPDLPFVYAPTQ